ncbi:hypothetical protein L2E82_42195 [Cichorium intybus]|uniref:Uncharacterized protein n=1 Tax=Cichorium intybus TaxID=13427 RepID=A0ACB8ZKQ7_CICIN|nr:hypothetical protein L2E82_42195 [Cichorium intybus]
MDKDFPQLVLKSLKVKDARKIDVNLVLKDHSCSMKWNNRWNLPDFGLILCIPDFGERSCAETKAGQESSKHSSAVFSFVVFFFFFSSSLCVCPAE